MSMINILINSDPEKVYQYNKQVITSGRGDIGFIADKTISYIVPQAIKPIYRLSPHMITYSLYLTVVFRCFYCLQLDDVMRFLIAEVRNSHWLAENFIKYS
jgi:hypothetical protein